MSRVVPLPASNTVVDSTVSIINADGTVGSVSAGTAASPTAVVGNAAAGETDSGAPVKIGGIHNTTLQVVAVGQRADLQTDPRGNLRTLLCLGNVAAADAVSNLSFGAYSIATNGASSSIYPLTGTLAFNGTSWDRARKANVSKRIASSAASGNPDFLKASAGELTQVWGQNGAAITYLQVYNKATAPTIGTDTPIFTYPIAALERFNLSFPDGGYYFATGIAYAFTTDAAATTGASAAAVTSCNIIGA
jgi:hypothetical protein